MQVPHGFFQPLLPLPSLQKHAFLMPRPSSIWGAQFKINNSNDLRGVALFPPCKTTTVTVFRVFQKNDTFWEFLSSCWEAARLCRVFVALFFGSSRSGRTRKPCSQQPPQPDHFPSPPAECPTGLELRILNEIEGNLDLNMFETSWNYKDTVVFGKLEASLSDVCI